MNPDATAGQMPINRGSTLTWATLLLGVVVTTTPQAAGADAQAPENPGAPSWSMFRGSPQQTGVVDGSLPERLTVRWKFEAPDAIVSTAAIAGGVVYVGCQDEWLYALDLATGALAWKYKAKEAISSSPTVLEGTVYFGDDMGFVHAVDARTGKGRWTFATDAQIISSVNHSDGRLVFGSYDAFVYCVSARDGTLHWKFETQGRVHGTPGISAGNVLVAGCDEYLHVLQLADGKSANRVSMGSVSGASTAIHSPHAYVGTYGGHMLCIDWKKGGIVWAFQDPDREFPVLSSAAVTDRSVIFGSRGKRLYALDRQTGKAQWTFITKGRIDSSPVVVGDRVFVGSSDGNLYAVDVKTGHEAWRFEAGGPISASPAIAGDSLVIGTEDGVVYCFGGASR